MPPPVNGLGTIGGFKLFVEDRADLVRGFGVVPGVETSILLDSPRHVRIGFVEIALHRGQRKVEVRGNLGQLHPLKAAQNEYGAGPVAHAVKNRPDTGKQLARLEIIMWHRWLRHRTKEDRAQPRTNAMAAHLLANHTHRERVDETAQSPGIGQRGQAAIDAQEDLLEQIFRLIARPQGSPQQREDHGSEAIPNLALSPSMAGHSGPRQSVIIHVPARSFHRVARGQIRSLRPNRDQLRTFTALGCGPKSHEYNSTRTNVISP